MTATTLPEEAVKAAQDAFHEAWNNNAGLDNALPAFAMCAALNAVLPFLPVQGAVKIKPLDWTEDSAPGYRLFSAQSDIGHFAYGTDADGKPKSSTPSNTQCAAILSRKSTKARTELGQQRFTTRPA
ncbi:MULTISPECIES: hypothetical protein [unclassified Brucella]|uniref:hypothetical protein n=1 Tax=unclassified Brucella TaxID=2632610 RepID=UPI00097294FB|nr:MULTISPECIES: hypothetical protein [unclassified Brucella]APY12992.1 hypothetical protein BKD02_00555 [Brucella sp. 09RB8910]